MSSACIIHFYTVFNNLPVSFTAYNFI